MDLTPMHKRVIALDVHQAKITACAVVEHDDGRVEVTQRDFGAFKRDRRALAAWAVELRPEVVVMESTGVYWKSPFAALEDGGLRGAERGAKCAALAEDAAQAWLHRHARHRLNLSYPQCTQHRPASGQVLPRLRRRFFHIESHDPVGHPG